MLLISIALIPFKAFSVNRTDLNNRDGYVGFSFMNFGYKEFNPENGALFDREDGVIPGISILLAVSKNGWRVGGCFSLFMGGVDYNGYSQNLVTGALSPLATRTSQDIVDGYVFAEYRKSELSQTEVIPYFGLGYHYWLREIQNGIDDAGNFVPGLSETYDWKYVFVGAKHFISMTHRSELGIDFRLLRIIDPVMTIDLGFAGLPRVSYDLGPRFGWRLAIPWHSSLDSVAQFIIEPYIESWELGQSRVKYGFYEPPSKTRNYGISVGITQRF